MDDAKGLKPRQGTSTLDLALRLVEHLSYQTQATSLGAIAKAFSASKATVYRHLHTLTQHGFVRQDPATGHYDIGVKLLVLGEACRRRFDVVRAAHHELMILRDKTGQAVTICALLDREVVVLELIQGLSVIEFGTRPGTRLDLHASAHGKTWLAFGPANLGDELRKQPLKPWTPETHTDVDALMREIEAIRGRGWSTAPDEVITGVNTLAAPVFDHANALVGTIAIVGPTQFIPAHPKPDQVHDVVETAKRISQSLGWRQ
ncbi:IclR family transcriptional regulator [Microvirga antarctica]|uniref:IclR family transcriptional regulator n=1 Tax=Microvirga antarctica TaxID=2819233 RepID=UPI001B3008F0|nr:IclR family transcriptional regulator [Microvirga antarctica]